MSDLVEKILIFFIIVLIVLAVVLVVLFGFVVVHSHNLTGTAIGYYSATYCDPNGCDVDQSDQGDYLYPGDALICPDSASVFQYFIFIGNSLFPINETYYLLPDTCRVQEIK